MKGGERMNDLAKLRCEFSLLASGLVMKVRDFGMMAAFNEVKRSNEQAIINAYGQAGRAHLAAELGARGFWDLAKAIVDNGAANGIRNSLHEQGLAVDLLMYDTEGNYLPGSGSYKELGEWWEMQHPLARWGGRFGDAGHFSFEHQGRK